MGKNKKNLVVFTGAGVSQESGIPTYRDKGGLWEKYDPEVYASINGWNSIREEMNSFYNSVRAELANVHPNECHIKLVELEKDYNVFIITQNVDDLHERAGSKNILHLHGELRKIRKYEDDMDNSKWINIGYLELSNSKLNEYRPAVVWFGEGVPLLSDAMNIVKSADIFLIIGTTLQVYPAATLLQYVNDLKPIYYIDPTPNVGGYAYINKIESKATEGINEFIKLIKDEK